jgi:hypothetical protein
MNFPGQLLIELLPPPEIPVEASGNWANVERQLGTTLPSDYKWFIETYGTGGICTDYINVLNPFAENPALNLIAHSKVTLDVYRRDQLETELRLNPHAVYPQPGVIFPWASSASAHEMFWLTRGDPDSWGVVFFDRNRIEFRTYEQTCMTQFLVTLLLGQMDGGKFKIPTKTPEIRPRFKAMNEVSVKKPRKLLKEKEKEIQERKQQERKRSVDKLFPDETGE